MKTMPTLATFATPGKKALQSPLFWTLAICLIVRLLYDKSINYISYNADSATYWLAGLKLMEGHIDEYRTPLYPLILQLVNLFGNKTVFEHVLLLQQAASLLSVIPFYCVVKRWLSNRPLAVIGSLLYGCHPSMMHITYGIFADSLLISALVCYVYLIQRFVQQPSGAKWATLCFTAFLMVMLKPVSLLLYVVLFLCGLYMLKPVWSPSLKRLRISTLIPAYLASVFLLGGFVLMNKAQNNFTGISTVTHDNRFANVVLSRAYETINDQRLVAIIDTARYYGHYYTVFYLNNDYPKYKASFDAFPTQYPLNDNMLGVKSIPPNTLGYDRKKLEPVIKKASRTRPFVRYMLADLLLFSGDTLFHVKGGLLNMIVYISLVLLLYDLFFHKRLDPMRALLFLLGAFLLYASIVGGIRDGTRERVLLPVFPLMAFLLVDCLNTCWLFLKPHLWKITTTLRSRPH